MFQAKQSLFEAYIGVPAVPAIGNYDAHFGDADMALLSLPHACRGYC